MQCPHCLKEIHIEWQLYNLGPDVDYTWGLFRARCPNNDCDKFILRLFGEDKTQSGNNKEYLVYPKTVNRAPIPSSVPDKFKEDYNEACAVLNDSPKASAALSRRCLQNLLRNKAGIKKGSLADEIQEVIDSKQMPSYLSESIDGIRVTGNFAAHPIKGEKTGEIVKVEHGEADWNLDVLELLFDFYFVQPAIAEKKKQALNIKLADSGKPDMKS